MGTTGATITGFTATGAKITGAIGAGFVIGKGVATGAEVSAAAAKAFKPYSVSANDYATAAEDSTYI